jgi:hypothetical protein
MLFEGIIMSKSRRAFLIAVIIILIYVAYGLYVRYESRFVAAEIHTAIQRDCSITHTVNNESINEHPFWTDIHTAENGEALRITCEIPRDSRFEWACECQKVGGGN